MSKRFLLGRNNKGRLLILDRKEKEVFLDILPNKEFAIYYDENMFIKQSDIILEGENLTEVIRKEDLILGQFFIKEDNTSIVEIQTSPWGISVASSSKKETKRVLTSYGKTIHTEGGYIIDYQDILKVWTLDDLTDDYVKVYDIDEKTVETKVDIKTDKKSKKKTRK